MNVSKALTLEGKNVKEFVHVFQSLCNPQYNLLAFRKVQDCIEQKETQGYTEQKERKIHKFVLQTSFDFIYLFGIHWEKRRKGREQNPLRNNDQASQAAAGIHGGSNRK